MNFLKRVWYDSTLTDKNNIVVFLDGKTYLIDVEKLKSGGNEK